MKEKGRKKNYFALILGGGGIGERLEEKIASPYVYYLP